MRFKLPEIPPPKLINALRSYKLLPAIVFVPSRRKCDESALEVAADKRQKTDAEKQRLREEIFEEYILDNPSESSDSRSFGLIGSENIIGKVVCKLK